MPSSPRMPRQRRGIKPPPARRPFKASLCEAAQCSHWVVRRSVAEVSNPKVLTEGSPFTHHLLALSFRASDRCHWRGNPSPRRAPRRGTPKPPSLPCHSEPVTDVTGVGIRLPPRRSAELPPPSVRWQREALTEGEPFTHHLLALSFRASDRCHWRGNPRPQAHPPPPHSNSFNFFSTKSSQNPLPAFKFFQVFSR